MFSKILPLISLVLIGTGLSGCISPVPKTQPNQIEKLNSLEVRVKELEKQAGVRRHQASTRKQNTPIGPIKSLTFREGTNDDRLRIYWADGSKSDLPCTKEQLIWACG